MKFFEKYSSNTCAGSGNQHIFFSDENTVHTGRVFYKIFCSGVYDYSLLFSNILDSTYSDGSLSHKNLICSSWEITAAGIGKADKDFFKKTDDTKEMEKLLNQGDIEIIPVTFDGSVSKKAAPGEFFCSDPVTIGFEEGDYLCLEISFKGKMIPYHEESILPIFNKCDGRWIFDKHMPVASMVGCSRKTKKRIAFLGDSITQGIGTSLNSYAHWNSVLSQKIGKDFAFWNLGLGFGRADDMASDGAWAYKAKHNDILVICYGVNDIIQGFTAEKIKENIERIADIFLKENKMVILQTIPPFNYDEKRLEIWKDVNSFILEKMTGKVQLVFDTVPILCEDEKRPHIAKYGGHPDSRGCAVWAEALYEKLCAEEIFKR